MKVGILLANLGTPDAPTPAAVKRYLREFLSDPRVIDVPKFKWSLILNALILPKRAPKVAKLYEVIWTEEGSPLLAISRQQQRQLQALLDPSQQKVVVSLGMTYGNPSIASALAELHAHAVDKIVVLPLYPQYSSTTTASVFDAFAKALQQSRRLVPFEFIHNYHAHPDYIAQLAESIQLTEGEFLLFSFHGIPARYETEGDFYASQCHATAQAVASQLGLTAEQWGVSFQSRFGSEPWLTPYTDETLAEFAQGTRKKVAVICPGFSVDCLETLEEIAEENREHFLAHGGESYRYIPALNANAGHIALFANLVAPYLNSTAS